MMTKAEQEDLRDNIIEFLEEKYTYYGREPSITTGNELITFETNDDKTLFTLELSFDDEGN